MEAEINKESYDITRNNNNNPDYDNDINRDDDIFLMAQNFYKSQGEEYVYDVQKEIIKNEDDLKNLENLSEEELLAKYYEMININNDDYNNNNLFKGSNINNNNYNNDCYSNDVIYEDEHLEERCNDDKDNLSNELYQENLEFKENNINKDSNSNFNNFHYDYRKNIIKNKTNNNNKEKLALYNRNKLNSKHTNKMTINNNKTNISIGVVKSNISKLKLSSNNNNNNLSNLSNNNKKELKMKQNFDNRVNNYDSKNKNKGLFDNKLKTNIVALDGKITSLNKDNNSNNRNWKCLNISNKEKIYTYNNINDLVEDLNYKEHYSKKGKYYNTANSNLTSYINPKLSQAKSLITKGNLNKTKIEKIKNFLDFDFQKQEVAINALEKQIQEERQQQVDIQMKYFTKLQEYGLSNKYNNSKIRKRANSSSNIKGNSCLNKNGINNYNRNGYNNGYGNGNYRFNPRIKSSLGYINNKNNTSKVIKYKRTISKNNKKFVSNINKNIELISKSKSKCYDTSSKQAYNNNINYTSNDIENAYSNNEGNHNVRSKSTDIVANKMKKINPIIDLVIEKHFEKYNLNNSKLGDGKLDVYLNKSFKKNMNIENDDTDGYKGITNKNENYYNNRIIDNNEIYDDERNINNDANSQFRSALATTVQTYNNNTSNNTNAYNSQFNSGLNTYQGEGFKNKSNNSNNNTNQFDQLFEYSSNNRNNDNNNNNQNNSNKLNIISSYNLQENKSINNNNSYNNNNSKPTIDNDVNKQSSNSNLINDIKDIYSNSKNNNSLFYSYTTTKYNPNNNNNISNVSNNKKIDTILNKIDSLINKEIQSNVSSLSNNTNSNIETIPKTLEKNPLHYFLNKNTSNKRLLEIERKTNTSILLHIEELHNDIIEDILLEEVIELNKVDAGKQNHINNKEKQILINQYYKQHKEFQLLECEIEEKLKNKYKQSVLHKDKQPDRKDVFYNSNSNHHKYYTASNISHEYKHNYEYNYNHNVNTKYIAVYIPSLTERVGLYRKEFKESVLINSCFYNDQLFNFINEYKENILEEILKEEIEKAHLEIDKFYSGLIKEQCQGINEIDIREIKKVKENI